MKFYAPLIGVFLLTGCISIDTHLQPINQTVNAVLIGTDCTPILFGFGAGVNRVEKATAKAAHIEDRLGPAILPITRIRSIAYTESMILSFGERCVEVVGE